jgi:hypothetical protein
MIAPETVYRSKLAPPTAYLSPEVRDLLAEHPPLALRGPEAVARSLRALRGVEADAFDVAVVLEALSVEGEVLA